MSNYRKPRPLSIAEVVDMVRRENGGVFAINWNYRNNQARGRANAAVRVGLLTKVRGKPGADYYKIKEDK